MTDKNYIVFKYTLNNKVKEQVIHDLPITIGRQATNVVVIGHESVSREHAAIVWGSNKQSIELNDLNSLNGISYLDDVVKNIKLTGNEDFLLGDVPCSVSISPKLLNTIASSVPNRHAKSSLKTSSKYTLPIIIGSISVLGMILGGIALFFSSNSPQKQDVSLPSIEPQVSHNTFQENLESDFYDVGLDDEYEQSGEDSQIDLELGELDGFPDNTESVVDEVLLNANNDTLDLSDIDAEDELYLDQLTDNLNNTELEIQQDDSEFMQMQDMLEDVVDHNISTEALTQNNFMQANVPQNNNEVSQAIYQQKNKNEVTETDFAKFKAMSQYRDVYGKNINTSEGIMHSQELNGTTFGQHKQLTSVEFTRVELPKLSSDWFAIPKAAMITTPVKNKSYTSKTSPVVKKVRRSDSDVSTSNGYHIQGNANMANENNRYAKIIDLNKGNRPSHVIDLEKDKVASDSYLIKLNDDAKARQLLKYGKPTPKKIVNESQHELTQNVLARKELNKNESEYRDIIQRIELEDRQPLKSHTVEFRDQLSNQKNTMQISGSPPQRNTNQALKKQPVIANKAATNSVYVDARNAQETSRSLAQEVVKSAISKYKFGFGKAGIKLLKQEIAKGNTNKELKVTLNQLNTLFDLYYKGNTAYNAGQFEKAKQAWKVFFAKEEEIFGDQTTAYSRIAMSKSKKNPNQVIAIAKKDVKPIVEAKISKKIDHDSNVRFDVDGKSFVLDSKGLKDATGKDLSVSDASNQQVDESKIQNEAYRYNQTQDIQDNQSNIELAASYYKKAVNLEHSNVREALKFWKKTLQYTQPGDVLHTKASAKVAWYQEWGY